MQRRDFLKVIAVSAATWPLAARGQDSGRIYRLGDLHLSPRNAPHNVLLFDTLKADGFIAGQNLIVDDRGFGLRLDELADHASVIVKAHVDVIVCAGEAALRAGQQATKTIPILAIVDDMVKSGFVTSLAKPDGNTTGVSILSTELDGKRQEILLEILPGVRRVAAIADRDNTSPEQLNALREAAHERGVELLIYRVTKAGEIEGALDAAKSSGAEALNVLAGALLFSNREIILKRVAALSMPAIWQFPTEAEEGGFIGYGTRLEPIFRDILARQLIKLLRGVKPAEIPVEQPTKFELVVNLKTAKGLGLTIPETFLQRADKVIE